MIDKDAAQTLWCICEHFLKWKSAHQHSGKPNFYKYFFQHCIFTFDHQVEHQSTCRLSVKGPRAPNLVMKVAHSHLSSQIQWTRNILKKKFRTFPSSMLCPRFFFASSPWIVAWPLGLDWLVPSISGGSFVERHFPQTSKKHWPTLFGNVSFPWNQYLYYNKEYRQ